MAQEFVREVVSIMWHERLPLNDGERALQLIYSRKVTGRIHVNTEVLPY